MTVFERQIELSKYARHTPKAPLDIQYNRGRQDCIEYNPYSDDAKYFLMCENKR